MGVMKLRAMLVMFVLAVLGGCKATSRGTVKTAPAGSVAASAVIASHKTEAAPDADCGLEAYPGSRSYQQVLTDADAGPRKPITTLETRTAIAKDGNITHFRFVRVSSIESVNKAAFDFVTKQHYKPAIFNGERVAVCATGSVTIDF